MGNIRVSTLWWVSMRTSGVRGLLLFFCWLVFSAFGGAVHEYRRILPSDPIDLDPARIEDVNALHIMLQVAEGLVGLDQNRIVPAIAERWETSADLKVYLFHLNPQAHFSDGITITANDVVRSFQYLLGNDSLVWRELSIIRGAKEFHEGVAPSVSGIEQLSPQTIKITLLKPFSPFLEIIATPPFVVLPQSSLTTLHNEKVAVFVSSGPYQLTRYEKNKTLRIERNAYYHDADNVYFDRISYDIVRSPIMAKAAFFGGLYDDIWPIFIEATEQLMGRYEQIPAYSANTWYLEFNLTKEHVAKLALRRFIAEHIDRKSFLRALNLPEHFASTRFIPRGLLGYDESPVTDKVASAEQLLESAKCFPKNPCAIELLYEKNVESALGKLFQPIREQYGNRVTINLKKIERHAWYKRFIEGDYEMLFLGNNIRYADAYSLLSYLMMDMYHPGLKRDEIGRQLETSFETSDRLARGRLYAHVDDLLRQQYAVIPIYHGIVPYLFVRKGFVGHNVSILGPHQLNMSRLKRADSTP